jgi:hypothetical protein
MKPVDMIEYTIKVKKVFKISVPKFVTEWDAIWDFAKKAIYEKQPFINDDFMCIETRENVEHPTL